MGGKPSGKCHAGCGAPVLSAGLTCYSCSTLRQRLLTPESRETYVRSYGVVAGFAVDPPEPPPVSPPDDDVILSALPSARVALSTRDVQKLLAESGHYTPLPAVEAGLIELAARGRLLVHQPSRATPRLCWFPLGERPAGRRSACKRGHSLDTEAEVRPDGRRVCRLCAAIHQERYVVRRRANPHAYALPQRKLRDVPMCRSRRHVVTPGNTAYLSDGRRCLDCRAEAVARHKARKEARALGLIDSGASVRPLPEALQVEVAA